MGQFEFPSFFRWAGDEILKRGDRWSLGWWGGLDSDCHVILPNMQGIEITITENFLLSPICKSRAMALIAFILKFILTKTDENIKFCLEESRLKS
jgi:hypothetical protein